MRLPPPELVVPQAVRVVDPALVGVGLRVLDGGRWLSFPPQAALHDQLLETRDIKVEQATRGVFL